MWGQRTSGLGPRLRPAWLAACLAVLIVLGGTRGVLGAGGAPLPAGAFIDAPDGYGLVPPPGWRYDGSLLPVEARWTSPGGGALLRVFSQPVAGAAGAAAYISYSNRSIDRGWNGLQLQVRWQHGATTYRQWTRPAMPLLSPDMRAYAEWDEVLTPDRVLTIMVNATPTAFPAARSAAQAVWRSARALAVAGVNAWPPATAAPARAPQLLPTVPGVVWGVFESHLNPQQPVWTPVLMREAELRARFGIVMVYVGLGKPFPTALVQQAWDQGMVAEVTLQSWAPQSEGARSLPYANGLSDLGAVLQGRGDAALRSFARGAAAVRVPFFLRWDNEMNGDWDPWSAFQWGKDADLYVAMWRHVYDLFQAAGATNAVWVWNPNNSNLPPYRWNAAALYYPGSAYVDWVGLTAYNLGNGQPGQQWRSFAQLFAPTYARDRALYPAKPLLITEFASQSGPGDKAAWIRAAAAALRQMPAIRYAVWWDADQGNLQYKLDQPPAAMQAFGQVLAADP